VSPLPTVCILAGGLGTRLGARVADTPKPLLEVAGKPFLLHQLALLAANGAERAVLCVGYLGEEIERRIGGERFGIRLEYSYDTPGLDGTLGAIRRAQHLLPERFLVLYGDTYLRLDYRAAVDTWRRSGRLGLMTVIRNNGLWDTSNVVYKGGRVLVYDKASPTPQMHWIDYGLGGLCMTALDLARSDERDLSSLQTRLAQRDELHGYEVSERFYEIGTPESLAEAEAFLASDADSTDQFGSSACPIT
jgi:NDP-sugar pyrophosphorylase family protein